MFKYSKLLLNNLGVPFRFRNGVIFSSKRIDIDIHEEKAHMAEIIMRDISSSRNFTEIISCSLTEKIKNSIQACSDVRSSVLDEMLQFFTTGVVTDRQIFNQSRHATEIFNFNKLNRSQEPEEKLKIRYFPTTLISRQVFNQLLSPPTPYLLMTGQKGVSKSISIQLYWQLSNIICSYRCREDKNKPRFQPIFYEIPKLLYWNINPEQTAEKVRVKILKQCSEIGQNLDQSSYLTRQGENLYKFYHKYNTPLVLVQDQFNYYVNLYRDNEKNKPIEIQTIIYKQRNRQNLTKQEQNDLEEYKKENQQKVQYQRNVKKCLYMLGKKNFDGIYFLTSVNFEKKIVEELDLITERRHVELQLQRFRYEQFLATKKALYELIDFFLFEVKEKMAIIPLFQSQRYNNPATLSRIRTKLFEKFSNSSYKIHLTPLSISRSIRKWTASQQIYLQTYRKFETINQKKEEAEFIDKVTPQLIELFGECIQSARKKFEANVKYFINKTDKNYKLNVLSALFLKNLNQSQKEYSSVPNNQTRQYEQNEYEEETSSKFEVDVNHILDSHGEECMKKIGDFSNDNSQLGIQYPKPLESCIDKTIFSCKGDGKLYCYFKYSDIQDFLRGIHNDVIEFTLSYSEQMVAYLHNYHKNSTAFENLFIETFASGGFNVEFPSIEVKLRNFLNKKLGFIPIPSTSNQQNNSNDNTDKKKKGENNIIEIIKNFSFLESFVEPLEYLQKKKIQCAVFVPLKEDFKRTNFLAGPNQIKLSHIDIYSPNIDLVMVKLPQTIGDSIHLYAIDLTLHEKPEKIKNKLNKFLNNFKLLKDNDQTLIRLNGENHPIKMHYFVLSASKNLCDSGESLLYSMNKLHGENFQFQQKNSNDILKVDSLKKNLKTTQTFLATIGNLYMGKDSMIIEKRERTLHDKSLWFFERLAQEIQKNITPIGQLNENEN